MARINGLRAHVRALARALDSKLSKLPHSGCLDDHCTKTEKSPAGGDVHMVLRKSALGWAAIAALSGCSPLGSNPGTMDEVRKAALGVVAAYNAQDAHAAAAYDAPDYVGIYHGSPNVVGPAADEAAMKSQVAAGHVDWQLGEGKVTLSQGSDLGIFEAPYTFVITNPDKSVTRETGNWIAIFRRQDDGSLKLWRSIASDTPPPKPAGAA